jgi:glycosyltransferase involved in cell wall biosynthesis
VVIVGEGPMMQEMKDLSGQLGIASHIEFLGKREDVDSLLQQSKVFILTSRSEGLSIAMAEGMVAGAVPVVADVGDLRDLVRDGENGYLIEPNTIEQYVERISGLLADDELYARLSAQAAWSGKNYNGIDVVSASWSKCIEEIVSNYPEKTDERRPKNRGKRRTPCIRKESNLSPTTSTS